MKQRFWFSILVAAAVSLPASATVVINEIFYHAPGDFDDLEWVELHNADSQPKDISGWRLSKGISFQFPDQTVIPPNGFVVLCKNATLFKEFYDAPVAGEFKKALSNSGEALDLLDALGKKVDGVTFTDREPWPVAADGYSSSLERITPTVAGDRPDNWAASPLPEDERQPAGTPGRPNANYSANHPPVISQVTVSPRHPAAGQAIKVRATVEDADGVQSVEVRYRLAGPGSIGEEQVVAMKRDDGSAFVAEIPGQADSQLLRLRIRAVDERASERYFPPAHDLRPALSLFVQGPAKGANIPLAHILHTDATELAAMERIRQRSLRPGAGPFGSREERKLQQYLSTALNLQEAWFEFTIRNDIDYPAYQRLRQLFLAKSAERSRVVEEALASDDAAAMLKSVTEQMQSIQSSLVEGLRRAIPGERGEAFQQWFKQQPDAVTLGPAAFVTRLLNFEAPWLALNLRFELSESELAALRPVFQAAVRRRSEQVPKLEAVMQRQGDFMEMLNLLGQVEKLVDAELREKMPLRHQRFVEQWKSSQGSPIRPRLTEMRPRPPRGRSAFVFVDHRSGQAEVYDFIDITERSAGYKVRFHRDRPFKGMSSANVIFEYNDRFLLAEPLAFELYRQIGNAACLTDYVRLTLNGHQLGYHLLFEQVDRSFLARNKINTGGDLYKILWYGRGIEGQHEKQNNPDRGYSDLVKLIESLESTTGDEQWQIIQRHFNVGQVVNYFAANMVLSHWDGFFNNYFPYHDRKGSGKWEMYPWDQDKTWGFHDASGEEVFFDMPLTFGMAGDRPPGGGEPVLNPGSWWRPGGYFSKPLLANPEFRKRFLARTRHILENVYTEAKFFPIIDELAERLKPEIPIRAQAVNEDPAVAMKRFERNVASLKEHLVKRRTFLLDQPELAAAELAGTEAR